MKVIHLIASVNPEQGGPFSYAKNMAQFRETLGHESLFITLDQESAEWVKNFSFPIVACGSRSRYRKAVLKYSSQFDVAIIHGLWNDSTISCYSALKINNTPWVVFTHGMLDPYFKKIKPIKNIVKQIYWLLWQGRVLSEAHEVLFTTQEELRLAENGFFGHNNYKRSVVSYCAADQKISKEDGAIELPDWLVAIEERSYLLFLSRIHPKKAIDNLIYAFAQIASQFPNVDLVIAGPDNNSYARDLKTKAVDVGMESRIFWPGMVGGLEKKQAFAHAIAFVLPSHQENFGQVVAEALSASLPVLVSEKVNIWREIVEDGAGLNGEDTIDDTKRVLLEFLSLDYSVRNEMKSTARQSYEQRYSVESAASALIRVLDSAIETRKNG